MQKLIPDYSKVNPIMFKSNLVARGNLVRNSVIEIYRLKLSFFTCWLSTDDGIDPGLISNPQTYSDFSHCPKSILHTFRTQPRVACCLFGLQYVIVLQSFLWQKCHRNNSLFSVHPIGACTLLFYCITGDINSYHLVKSICQVSPLEVNKSMLISINGRYLETV